jgi:hypothetical protein
MNWDMIFHVVKGVIIEFLEEMFLHLTYENLIAHISQISCLLTFNWLIPRVTQVGPYQLSCKFENFTAIMKHHGEVLQHTWPPTPVISLSLSLFLFPL